MSAAIRKTKIAPASTSRNSPHSTSSNPHPRNPTIPSLFKPLSIALLLIGHPARTPAQADQSYHLTLPVNEVSLTFHAADAHGLPVNDLKLDELRLFDNGKPPRRVVDFRLLQDFPIRAGILLDTSESMQRDLPANRSISLQYAQHILRRQTDQAFIMDFGFVSNLRQNWTGDPNTLTAAIRQVVAGKDNPLGGTALFETIFRACLYQFGKIDHAASANFILLFSDGEDNVSHVSLEDVVAQCQHANTAIYAFHMPQGAAGHSTGPGKLIEMAAQTGGRVFQNPASDTETETDLRLIEADLRNQYRLVYNPAQIRPDGSFHRIDLLGPDRAGTITVRSGYYAPKQ